MSVFAFQQQFPDEASCLAFMETQRWGENGANRYCPHCGSLKFYRFADGTLCKCGDCRKKFTVTVGTMFGNSHVPLQKWLYALSLNTSLKKGIVTRLGYKHRRVNHGKKDFVIGQNHITTIEGAWSHLKLSIQAVYIGIRPKHWQK